MGGEGSLSGHSKWHNRIHRKARQDAKRGAIYSKLGKEIYIAARSGGPDPLANTRLRMAVERARQAAVPAENIRRAIERGAGAGDTDYEELLYEGYGAGGAAVLVAVQTDNRNRTAGDIRYIFSRNGGNLGEAGCVAWMFEKRGLLIIDRQEEPEVSEERVLVAALDAGAEDVRAEEDSFSVITAVEDLDLVRNQMEASGLHFADGEVAMLPKTTIPLSSKDAEQLNRMIELLEDHEDVSAVYTNADDGGEPENS